MFQGSGIAKDLDIQRCRGPWAEVSAIWLRMYSKKSVHVDFKLLQTSERGNPLHRIRSSQTQILSPHSLEEQADDIDRFRGPALADVAERRSAQPLLGACSILPALNPTSGTLGP